jgi:hypothetical protein
MTTPTAESEIRLERPAQVTRAVQLMWISLALAIAASIPAYLEPSPTDFPMPVWSLWLVLALVWLVWVLLIFLVARRHNWARVAMLVLFIAGVGSSIWDPSALLQLPVYSLAVEAIDTLISALALYWLFTGRGAVWFRPPRATKHAL